MKNILFLLLFTYSFSFSQNYIALDTTDYEKRTALIKKITKNHTSLKKIIKKEYRGEIRKQVKMSYEKLFENFSKDIESRKLVFNTIFSTYIDSLKFAIISSNKNLIDTNIDVYISKHNSPNALSMGYGYILLNMGLFKYLENEDQLAAVLSHEIAHQLLKHSEKNIFQNAKLETSTEKKKQAKRIKKKKYNKQSEAFTVLKDILYSNSKKHRKEETAADSLGFELYKRTEFSPAEFLNTLKLLAKFDSLPSIKLENTTYKKIFDLDKQPFNEEWMKMENYKTYNYKNYKNKIDEDSIKSHPELIDRINRLKEIFPKDVLMESTIVNKKNESEFKRLKKIAQLEDVANLSYSEEYGLSIYLILYRLEKNTENDYYKKWLGINFQKLYDAKKKYQFNKYVAKIIPNEQDDSYQQFLSFLWNLSLNEIKFIAEYYN